MRRESGLEAGGVTTRYLYSGDSLIGLVTAQHELFFISGDGCELLSGSQRLDDFSGGA